MRYHANLTSHIKTQSKGADFLQVGAFAFARLVDFGHNCEWYILFSKFVKNIHIGGILPCRRSTFYIQYL